MFLSFLALRFLLHTTGSDIARKKSIRVEFMQDDHGMICAHTCAKLVILPRGVFTDTDSYIFQHGNESCRRDVRESVF